MFNGRKLYCSESLSELLKKEEKSTKKQEMSQTGNKLDIEVGEWKRKAMEEGIYLGHLNKSQKYGSKEAQERAVDQLSKCRFHRKMRKK